MDDYKKYLPLKYSEEALGHLDKIAAHLVIHANVSVAEEIIDRLLEDIGILSGMPFLGREHPDPVLVDRGYRILFCEDYAAVYLIDDEVWVAGVYPNVSDYLQR
jgi:plasmid stabilization system protein ParE